MINNPGSAIDFSDSVPITRKINGHALSSDITLTAADVGALSTSGTAASATKLVTSRTIRTNLGSTATVSFDGTANITPGVTGTLSLANGGTGSTTRTGALSNLGAVDAQDPFMWRTVDFVRPEGKDSPITIASSTSNTTFNVGYLRNAVSGTSTKFTYKVKLPYPIYTNLYTYQFIIECWGNVSKSNILLYKTLDSISSMGALNLVGNTQSASDASSSLYWPHYQKMELFVSAISNWMLFTRTGKIFKNNSDTATEYNNDVGKTDFTTTQGTANYIGISIGTKYSSGTTNMNPWYTYGCRVSYRAFINSVR